jgi:SAM-dependent methyltransferase
MDAATYAVEAEVEATHWWFVARRNLLRTLIGELGIASSAPALDLGTSTGTNLRMLSELGFTDVTGLDLNDEAIRWCAEKGLGTVRKGDVCELPFADLSFDLVLATDIVEHVDDDGRALSEIRRVLRPGGAAVISVPAFASLWGLQDEVAHHKRRYRMKQLIAAVGKSGLAPQESFHFNYLLFAPIWAARQVMRLARIRVASENQVNTPLLNRVLGAIFAFDVRTARIVRPPFGVSIMLVARRGSG